MEFHLRDPSVVQKLIDATAPGNFAPQEQHKLIWDGHSSHTYDITSSVHTFHLLTKSYGTNNLSHLLENWRLMSNIKLSICHNHNTVTFLPNGIISVYSRIKGNRAFHVGNPKEIEELVKFLQQG